MDSLDANAATEIVQRNGLYRVMHLDTVHSWAQQQHARRLLSLSQAPGAMNVAHLMTKHLNATVVAEYLEMMNLEKSSPEQRPDRVVQSCPVSVEGCRCS